MASVTIGVNVTPTFGSFGANSWLVYALSGADAASLGTALSEDGATEQFFRSLSLFYSGVPGHIIISLALTPTSQASDPGPDFSTQMEEHGTILFTSSDGGSVEVQIANDFIEPYGWSPSNAADVAAFTNNLIALTDRSLTIVFDDNANIAPSFTDDTGDDQDWTQNTAITPITVPEADGEPAPTYAPVGTLPAGILFNDTTRVISGTPTAVGSGTITIRATNAGGTADWTVDYTTAAALVAPSFVGGNGDAQNWTVGTAIASVAIPQATGVPDPTYSQIGTAPAGIIVTLPTSGADGAITGTPTVVGSGTIRIGASNSEGVVNWTVTYTITVLPAAPAFADNTGDAQSWFTNVTIANITVPAATGSPLPTYEVVGNLPAGIAFDTATRVFWHPDSRRFRHPLDSRHQQSRQRQLDCGIHNGQPADTFRFG